MSFDDFFSPSIHWEHCLRLEKEMQEVLEFAPIGAPGLKNNLKLVNPQIVDIFTKSCFLIEAAFKKIFHNPTKQITSALQNANESWSKSLLNGRNCTDSSENLSINDYLTFFNWYCSLSSLEPRIKYSQHLSDVWINSMLTSAPYREMQMKDSVVVKSPEWWQCYNKVKHEFYSYPKVLNLEITVEALAALISFSAVVPQMRGLLCDHGFFQDNSRKPIPINRFGYRNNGVFARDQHVKHSDLVLEGHENDEFLPPSACVSKLFVVQITGAYKKMQLWSGLG